MLNVIVKYIFLIEKQTILINIHCNLTEILINIIFEGLDIFSSINTQEIKIHIIKWEKKKHIAI
jgi:hypothetical protein